MRPQVSKHYKTKVITTAKESLPIGDNEMDRETLYSLVEERVNDIFLEYQTANGIKSGDLSPMQSLQLDELQNTLTDLIMSVGSKK